MNWFKQVWWFGYYVGWSLVFFLKNVGADIGYTFLHHQKCPAYNAMGVLRRDRNCKLVWEVYGSINESRRGENKMREVDEIRKWKNKMREEKEAWRW